MKKPMNHFYEFGSLRLDATNRLLYRNGVALPLQPRVIETLIALIENHNAVVDKDSLINAVWGETAVEESGLTRNISILRKALGPEGKFIETLPKRGYRFTDEVRETWEDSSAAPSQVDANELILERRASLLISHEEEITDSPISAKTIELGAAQKVARAPRRVALLVSAAITLILVAAFSFMLAAGKIGTGGSAPRVRSIAILPFRPLGADQQAENYLGVGLADALITRLGGLKEIAVLPTSAVLRFDNLTQDSLAAARSLGVDAVLEGSFQLEGDRLRVTAQLVGAHDGAQIWAGRFDEKLTDIFAVQDSISEQAARALALKLGSEEQRQLRKRYTESTEAYQAYLKGRHFWNKRTGDDLKKSIGFFQQALDLDPIYAPAYAGLADSYLLLGVYGGLPVEEASQRGGAAATKALELDDTLAEAHASLGFMKNSFAEDYRVAEESFKRAIEINPNYATAHHWYALYLMTEGRHEEAIAEIKRAAELDPLSLMINTDLGLVLSIARRYDEAIAQFQKTLELDPNFFEARHLLGQVYLFKGMWEEAVAEWRKVPMVGPSVQLGVKVCIGYAYALSGRRDQALKNLDEVRALERDPGTLLYQEAQTFALLGDKEEAFKTLEKLSREAPRLLRGLRTYPTWDSLRTDPRFTELLRQAGFAD